MLVCSAVDAAEWSHSTLIVSGVLWKDCAKQAVYSVFAVSIALVRSWVGTNVGFAGRNVGLCIPTALTAIERRKAGLVASEIYGKG